MIGANDFTNDDGILMVGLSNQLVPILQALRKKTGYDMSVIIALSIKKTADTLLNEQEKKDLNHILQKAKNS